MKHKNNFLDLAVSSLKEVEFQSFLDLLSTNKIKLLSICSCNIPDEMINDIVKNIESSDILDSLSLTDSIISDYGITIIAKFLQSNKTLKSIYLADNDISDIGMNVIAKAIEVNKYLTTMDLSSYKELGNSISDAVMKVICEALKKNNNLTTLHLISSHVSDVGARNIAKILETNKSLINVSLSSWKENSHNNGITYT